MLNAEFGRLAFRTQRSASAAGAEPRIVVELEPEPGRTLLELLARQTRLLLSNCGGRGRCGKCRVRIVAGQVSPPSAREQALLKACELKQGIRLACACSGASRIRLELPEWIVMNPKPSPARRATVIQQPTPAVLHQLGLAVDVGTTNVAVELVVLASGRVLRSSSFLKPQASFALDVVSRIGQSPAVIADNALVPALKGLLAEWQVRPTRLRRIVA
ncbi:MAG: 2Fe-2S iron-sulfur cluster-binding protein, partial [candidate division WOR-3 bacterium]